MKEEKIIFPSSGIRLEGLMSINEALSAKGGVVLCHPHPQHGGDMHNPVIVSGVQGASEAGLSTLRFNFRGVGESEGRFADGIGEREDVQAAVDCLNATFGERVHSLILFGYSFGAWAGIPVAVRDGRIHGMVVVAPPLEMYDFGFLKGCKKNKRIVAGSQDAFCPLPLLEKWYQSLEEPKSLTIIEGADHFFFSHHRSLILPFKEIFKTVSQENL
jgi:alpha/beta superfamily hydrolase